jgi:rare lipoprotein A
LLFAVWLTALALPVLAIDNFPRTDARAASIQSVSADAIDIAATAASTLTGPAPRPTTGVQSSKTTDPAPSSTRPSAPPMTPPATTTEAPVNAETGGASWYDYNPGECAHLSIAKGTVVTVTGLGTGASVTCVVTDRGPHVAGRIIDLDRGTFAQLSDPSVGVIQVRITW